MKIYLARSISGLSYAEVMEEYRKTTKLLSPFYVILNPMTAKGHLKSEVEFASYGKYTHPVSVGHAIYERDKWMVSTCDVLLADLSGTTKVSIGVMMELAWAALLGKHTVLILPEENIHTHTFVRESADVVFTDYDEAIEYLQTLSKSFIGA